MLVGFASDFPTFYHERDALGDMMLDVMLVVASVFTSQARFDGGTGCQFTSYWYSGRLIQANSQQRINDSGTSRLIVLEPSPQVGHSLLMARGLTPGVSYTLSLSGYVPCLLTGAVIQEGLDCRSGPPPRGRQPV